MVQSIQKFESDVQFKKPKAGALVKQLSKEGIEKTQEEYQQVVEEREQAVALLRDDLQDLEKKIQTISYKNVGFQGKIKTKYQLFEKCKNTLSNLRECYIDHVRDPATDSVIKIVKKHTISATNKYHDLSY